MRARMETTGWLDCAQVELLLFSVSISLDSARLYYFLYEFLSMMLVCVNETK
jgi:hypothetical protein